MTYAVVGDIGGTKTRVAVCNTESNQPIIKETYESRYVKHFYECINFILKETHEKYGIGVDKGCFCIAGPIDQKRTRAKATNLPWGISKKEILDNTYLDEVLIVNDLEAAGYGINVEKDKLTEIHHEHAPRPSYAKTAAVIAAGTGLGMSILIFDKMKGIYHPYCSEGGHADLVPRDEMELRLIRYLKKHVSAGHYPGWERVVSGQGLANIYGFLRDEKYEKENEITRLIDKAEDKPPLITKHASHSSTCAKAIDMFIDFYARAARELALISMATDGIYLTGGMPCNMAEHFLKPHFIHTFERNDRMGKILRNIPVHIMTDEDINLKGCCLALKNESHLR